MESGFEDNFSDFNAAMQRKVDELGMAGPLVVHQEAGQLTRTLIELTGPKNRGKRRAQIAQKVSTKFTALGYDHPHQAKENDIEWYAFYPDAVFGVATDKDLRNATVDELYKVFFSTKVNDLGRIVGKTRGKQTYYIWQKILTKAARVKQLIKRLQDHLGRQKAAWAVSWQYLGSPQGTLGPVPEWVLKHVTPGQVKGFYVDGLGVKGHPTFTVVNRALGISKARGIVSQAMRIRAGAISKDLVLYIRGVKKAK